MAKADGNVTGAPPVANRSVVQGELKRALRSEHRNPGSSVLLLRAAPEWRDDAEFDADIDGSSVPVAVAACPTVLAVLDALASNRDTGRFLVVLTQCETHEVGDSVLARAMRPEIKPINRWDLVQDAFGARYLDQTLTRSENRWVAEALLNALPASGWRRLAGPVLTEATALNRLAAARLGMGAADGDGGVDAAALLDWTADPAAVVSFLALRDDERAGLVKWLKQTAKPVADVVFAMAKAGKITDAVPFGLVAAALYSRDDALTARIRAEERYLAGNSVASGTMRTFGEAAESLVIRWTDNGHAPQAADMCERAEVILGDLGGGAVAGESKVLEAGLNARFAALADALGRATSEPDAVSLAAVEDALVRVREHGRKTSRDAEVRAAEAAVRLARWLAIPEGPPGTLADGAVRMLRYWAWADRALVSILRADTSRIPRLEGVYASLWDKAKRRRAQLDAAFAGKLAAWTQGSSATDSLLLVENVMERVARSVAVQRLPVIVVLDGMSAAVGCELAEEITGSGLWMEAGRRSDGREPVLATVPSVTAISRTSLLTGALRSGGQAEERAGFTAFWGRRKSLLFHKADLTPEPGQPLSSAARAAIAEADAVVGVVLNTIDDMLGKEKPGGPAHWTVADVTYLRQVLDEARRASRPVILTADHGHVLDRGQPPNPAQSDSARYRAGTPGPGEITVRGPRVLAGGGEVVAAVDETVRYTPKKAGYHGGASPAEVVVPVITLLPSESLLPPGWFTYDAIGHAPAWWEAPAMGASQPSPTPDAAMPRVKPSSRKRLPAAETDDGSALFGVSEIMPPAAAPSAASSLGAEIAASPRMASQRQFVRRAPGDASVAALIDGLIQAGGRLTITEAAAAAGEAPVRMSGYLAQVTRLLNVDGYAVLQATDGGRMVELNQQLLKQQFLGE